MSEFFQAYIRHLFQSKEILACTLLSLHNINFFINLLDQARMHIENGDYSSWNREWIARYESEAGGKIEKI